MAEPNLVVAGVCVPEAISRWQKIEAFALSGKFISALFIAAIALGSQPALLAARGVSQGLLTACFAAGICLISYRLGLRLRCLVVVFAVAGLIVALTAPIAAKPAYGVGLMIIHPIADPAHRAFWPDPNYIDFPDHGVFVQTDGGDVLVDMTTEAGREMAYSGVMMDLGEQALSLVSRALMGVGGVLAAFGSLLRLTGVTSVSASRTPDLFENINRFSKTGLIILCLGGLVWMICVTVQDILQWFSPHDWYRVAGAAAPHAQRFGFGRYLLEKAVFSGSLLAHIALLVILAGHPRRALFRWFDRRGQEDGATGFDAPLKKAGVLLFVLGVLAVLFNEHVLRAQIIPTFRDVRDATMDDYIYELPAWLDAMRAVTDLWVIPTILGILCLVAGSKTVRLVIALILRVGGGSFGSRSTRTGKNDPPEESPSSGGRSRATKAQGDNGLSEDEIAGGAHSSRRAGRR